MGDGKKMQNTEGSHDFGNLVVKGEEQRGKFEGSARLKNTPKLEEIPSLPLTTPTHTKKKRKKNPPWYLNLALLKEAGIVKLGIL